MVKSGWVYRKLRNFRAGIEAGISCLQASLRFGTAAPGADSIATSSIHLEAEPHAPRLAPTGQTILSPAGTSKTRGPPHALDPNLILAPYTVVKNCCLWMGTSLAS
jgi:hypothetical protein